jgi:hypothetical protein
MVTTAVLVSHAGRGGEGGRAVECTPVVGAGTTDDGPEPPVRDTTVTYDADRNLTTGVAQ